MKKREGGGDPDEEKRENRNILSARRRREDADQEGRKNEVREHGSQRSKEKGPVDRLSKKKLRTKEKKSVTEAIKKNTFQQNKRKPGRPGMNIIEGEGNPSSIGRGKTLDEKQRKEERAPTFQDVRPLSGGNTKKKEKIGQPRKGRA